MIQLLLMQCIRHRYKELAVGQLLRRTPRSTNGLLDRSQIYIQFRPKTSITAAA